MSSVTLFNLLGNSTTGGTWSRVSTTGPAAPNTYNGSIDFATPTLFAAGSYIYRYTVTVNSVTATSDVTVIWQGVAPDRVNDTCATAFEVHGASALLYDATVEDDNLDNCPVNKTPTVPNPTDYPAEWNQGTYSGDLWYKMLTPNKAIPYMLVIEVDSSTFNDDGAKGIGLQVFTNTGNTSCASDVSYKSVTTSVEGQKAVVSMQIAAGQSYTIRFRVASVVKGKYYIMIKTQA